MRAGPNGRSPRRPYSQGRRPPIASRIMRHDTWLPAVPASARVARSIVRDACAEVGLDSDRTWDLMLATSEAFANAIQHGRAWSNECILLTTEPCPGGLRVEVTDCGSFTGAPEPTPIEATSGRGIPIIAAVVDHLEVQNGSGRTLVRFERHAAPETLRSVEVRGRVS
jgi:serine/threonine-protein kinase RsbW